MMSLSSSVIISQSGCKQELLQLKSNEDHRHGEFYDNEVMDGRQKAFEKIELQSDSSSEVSSCREMLEKDGDFSSELNKEMTELEEKHCRW